MNILHEKPAGKSNISYFFIKMYFLLKKYPKYVCVPKEFKNLDKYEIVLFFPESEEIKFNLKEPSFSIEAI